MPRLNIRISSWLKEVLERNARGNYSKYIKNLILQDNSREIAHKKIPCIRKIKTLDRTHD